MAEKKKVKPKTTYIQGDRVVTRDRKGKYVVMEYRNGNFRQVPWNDTDQYALMGGFFFGGRKRNILQVGRHGPYGTTVHIDQGGNMTTLDNYNRRTGFSFKNNRNRPTYFIDRSSNSLEKFQQRQEALPGIRAKERETTDAKNLARYTAQADRKYGYMSNNDIIKALEKLRSEDSYKVGRPKWLQEEKGIINYLKTNRFLEFQEGKGFINIRDKTISDVNIPSSSSGDEKNGVVTGKTEEKVTNADIPVFSELKGAKSTEWEGKNLKNQPNLKVTRWESDGKGGKREVTYMTHQPQKGPIPRNRNKLAVTEIPETWARGQGRKLKDVNRDTALALQSQGWDLKGIPKSDLRRLYADFRTGRAVVFEKPDGKYLHYNGKVYHNSNTGEITVGKDDQLRINKSQNRVNEPLWTGPSDRTPGTKTTFSLSGDISPPGRERNRLHIGDAQGDFRVPDKTYA